MEGNIDRKAAEERVRAKVGFLRHATTYVLVMALLVVINLVTSREHLWFVWPLLGWGVGLVSHGIGVFLKPTGARVFERMVEHEMRHGR